MRQFWGILLFLFATSSVYAVVDMKNANYTNSWVDLQMPGTGYDLKIVRTYNSRALFNGMLGFGWCTDFETTLVVTPESNVRITECGAGQDVLFFPREFAKKDVDVTVNKIIAKLKEKKGGAEPETYWKNLAAQLAFDADKRAQYLQEFGITSQVKEGTQFKANGREVENVVFAKGMYTRNMADGTSQRFNTAGKLTHLYDKNGNFLKLEYDKGLLKDVSDNGGRTLSFKFYDNKKVKSISGPNGLTVEYKFQNLEDLQWVKNSWDNIYTYEYDDLHNLTKANYPDGTFVGLTYDKTKDWVLSFTDRQKCIEEYKYETSKDDPRNHYWSTVEKKCEGKVVANNRYEFWFKSKPEGFIYLYRILTKVGDLETDITYHDVFGKPVEIRKNKDRSIFTYYDDGQVKSKASPGSKIEFAYDSKVKKVSEVKTTFYNQKNAVVAKRSSVFSYDAKGNLYSAKGSNGQVVKLTYDNRGRIETITDQAKRLVKITYDERYGKPHVVSRPGMGSIRINYKPSGEILKVDSPDGPNVAVQMASTFNNLLEIIAPATAEIYL